MSKFSELWAIATAKLKENVISIAVAGVLALIAAVWGWARAAVTIEIPVGAVVAFDLADGCPKDGQWVAFGDANNRVIVGAAGAASTPEQGDDGVPLIQHRFRERAGADTTRLAVANLPPFDVQLFYNTSLDEGDKPAEMVRNIVADHGNHAVQLKAGGTAERFSRTMPSISLNMCKKIR
jgi:hypothetical protein